MKRLMMVAVLLTATGIQAGELTLELSGKEIAGKQVRLAVCSSSETGKFPVDEKLCRRVIAEAASDRLKVEVHDLPPGKYVVTSYVDNNRNGRLDKNFLGIPQEKYGFSNDARSRFGPPDFADAEFEVGTSAVSRSIQLH